MPRYKSISIPQGRLGHVPMSDESRYNRHPDVLARSLAGVAAVMARRLGLPLGVHGYGDELLGDALVEAGVGARQVLVLADRRHWLPAAPVWLLGRA